MQVYKNLDNLSDCTAGERKTHQLIQQFEAVRTDANATSNLFDSIPIDDRLDFSKDVVKVIKDWDRLSFSHLYKECCWLINRALISNILILDDYITENLINRNQGDVVIPIVSILNKLNSNGRTIEYACKIDLEHIDELHKNDDVQGLKELLTYSEDCDTKGYQCEYKTIAEDRIKLYLSELGVKAKKEKQEQNRQADKAKRFFNLIQGDISALVAFPEMRPYIEKDSNGSVKWIGIAQLYAYLAFALKIEKSIVSFNWDVFMELIQPPCGIDKTTFVSYVSKFGKKELNYPDGYENIDECISLLNEFTPPI